MIGYRHKVPEVFYLFIFPFKSNSLGFNEPGGCFFSPTKKKSRYAFLWNLIMKKNIMLFVSDGVASLIKPQLSCYYYIFFVCCNFGVKIAIIVSMSIVSFTHFLVETNFFFTGFFFIVFLISGASFQQLICSLTMCLWGWVLNHCVHAVFNSLSLSALLTMQWFKELY